MTIRNGHKTVDSTPIPRIDRERDKRQEAPVKTYKLSPEELERYRAMDKTKSVPAANTAQIVKEDEVKVAEKLTKDEYLQMRLSGVSRTQMYKTHGLNPNAFYKLLKDWGLKDPVVEEKWLRLMRLEAKAAAAPSVEPPNATAVDFDTKAETLCAICQKEPTLPGVMYCAECEGEYRGMFETVDKPVDELVDHLYKPNYFNLERKVTMTVTLTELVMREAVKCVIDDVHQTAVEHGWYESPVPMPVALALIHSEVSEALDAHRKEHGDDKVAEELADVVIRVMDTAAANELDLAGALFRKMAKSKERGYRHGGLKY